MSDPWRPRFVLSSHTDHRWTPLSRPFDLLPYESTSSSSSRSSSPSTDDRIVDLDSITDVILDTNVVKYVTLRVYDGETKQTSKHIVRGYRNPTWRCMQMDVNRIPHGPDEFVLRKVEREMAQCGVAVYDVVGWGRAVHDVNRKYVTFYEEVNPPRVTANGHSEQCFWARRLIDEGQLGQGYHTYHVDKNGITSPESKRRQLRKFEVEFPFIY